MSSIKNLTDRVLLVILDGYGIRPNTLKNAVASAKTPNLDHLFEHYPYTTIKSSGLSVGLPQGLPGNSEVGHLNLGAGKIIKQDLVRINESVEQNILRGREKIQELIKKAKKSTGRIHLMGLLSDGGVHSHIDHIKQIIEILGDKEHGLEIFYHAFTDGRDTPRDSGINYIAELLDTCKNFHFASVQGRFWGMDRDKRFDRIEKAYNMFIGKGEVQDISPLEYVKEQYAKEVYDEFIEPVLFNKDFAIKNDDCIFFMNFRPDRAIELTQTFNLPEFPHFERPVLPSYYLCMTPYIADEMKLPILFDKENLSGGLSDYISSMGLKQYKVAETEKYAHVTFFFNGGRKESFGDEERVLIPSPKEVKTYDEKPQMSAPEVCDALLEALEKKDDVTYFTVNFANSDMVGHTGVYEAAVTAIETLDACVGKLMKKCEEKGITMILTSDHGNSDQMVYEDGNPHTSHTASDVPFCVFHQTLKDSDLKPTDDLENLALKDVAPTLLYVIGKDVPEKFEGKPIFK